MFEVKSRVRGFHVYKELWTPYVGENLQCIRESGNRDNPFAVAVKHNNDTVGHVVKCRMGAAIPFSAAYLATISNSSRSRCLIV